MTKGNWPVQVLFVLACLLASLLGLLILLAPLLEPGSEGPAGWGGAVLALFARDAVVRRISLAGAIGLVVTAFVFFRPAPPAEPQEPPQPREPAADSSAPQPPRRMAGA